MGVGQDTFIQPDAEIAKKDGSPSPLKSEINLQYLQVELARIDIFVRREVRCWQAAGQDPNDAFRGLAISETEAGMLSKLPFGGNWKQTVEIPLDEEDAFQNAIEQAK